MFTPKLLDNKDGYLALAAALAVCLVFPACSVSVKDHDSGDSKVDIETPIGGIHVNEEADVHDTGLPPYPGARQKPSSDGETKSANVNISSGLFGVKVVAIEYESDDPPGKILAFYRKRMTKFGDIVECHTDKHGGDMVARSGEHGSRPVSCEGDNSGNVVELKTGTEDNEHLVSVEPHGKGSDFAVVYIRTRGKQADI
ncbi:MAG TPA: hypothetical protein VEI26_06190 [Terriglobales bacterium]|nr:hypothetical protein [Terriglobales bacterium]